MKPDPKIDLRIHASLLGFCLYVAALPFFSGAVSTVLPGIWRCQYLRITGNPCPFCGYTRKWNALFAGESPDLPLTLFLIFLSEQILFRILAIILLRLGSGRVGLIRLADAILTIPLLIMTLAVFFIRWKYGTIVQ